MNDNNPSVVLVVDDSVANLMTAKRVLDRHGYVVLTAESGLEALDVIENKPVDLILMDIMMPEMDGFETCRRLKKNSAFADIPLIFLTALGDTDSMTQGFEVGGIDYIIKPFQRIELIAKIKNHLELNAFHKIQSAFMEKINSDNVDLHSKNSQLARILENLPKHLSRPLIDIEDVCLRMSARLQDDQDSREDLKSVLDLIGQLRLTVDALTKLHVH